MAYPSNLQGMSDPGHVPDPAARQAVQELQDATIDLANQIIGLSAGEATPLERDVIDPYGDVQLWRRIEAIEKELKLLDLTVTAAGDTYAGQYKITYDADADTVDVSAGKVVNGTTVTTVAADTDISVSGATYLSLEIWYNAGWFTDYLAAGAYPTQAKKDGYWTLRVLIAEKVDDAWTQQRFGEIHNTRLVS